MFYYPNFVEKEKKYGMVYKFKIKPDSCPRPSETLLSKTWQFLWALRHCRKNQSIQKLKSRSFTVAKLRPLGLVVDDMLKLSKIVEQKLLDAELEHRKELKQMLHIETKIVIHGWYPRRPQIQKENNKKCHNTVNAERYLDRWSNWSKPK